MVATMKPSSKLILGGFATFFIMAVSKGYGYYKQLKYKVSKVTLTKVESAVADMNLYLSVYNPTPVNLTVNKVLGNLYLNGLFIGVIDTTVEQTILANKVSTVTMPLKVALLNTAVNAIANLIKGNDYNGWTLKCDFVITVASVPVRLKLTYNLEDIING